MLTSIVWVHVMEIIHILQNLELTSLSKLEVQHSHTSTIEFCAFSGLTESIILNLSYSHLDDILAATSEDTAQL
jgi:hypothetical protein